VSDWVRRQGSYTDDLRPHTAKTTGGRQNQKGRRPCFRKRTREPRHQHVQSFWLVRADGFFFKLFSHFLNLPKYSIVVLGDLETYNELDNINCSTCDSKMVKIGGNQKNNLFYLIK